jgi:hypothetical protein
MLNVKDLIKMEPIVFFILIIQLLIIIGLSVASFKDQILNFMLGIRRKRVMFLDLRLFKYITLSKDLKTFTFASLTYVWNFQKELNGCCFYHSQNSEALDAKIEASLCKYWCDSNEYHTNLKNKLLETMMMLRNKDQIIQMMVIVIIIALAILALVWMKTSAIQESLNVITAAVK